MNNLEIAIAKKEQELYTKLSNLLIYHEHVSVVMRNRWTLLKVLKKYAESLREVSNNG